MSNQTKDEPGYLERISAGKPELAATEVEAINNAYGVFKRAASNMESNTITAANCAREVGILLQSWSGHELLDPTFWREQCGELKLDYKTAQICVSVARKMPQPAKTLAEAMQFVRVIHEAAKQIELIRRDEAQQKSTRSMVEDFLGKIFLVAQPFEKAVRERPMDKWPQDSLRSFMNATNWIADKRMQAQELLRNEKAS